MPYCSKLKISFLCFIGKEINIIYQSKHQASYFLLPLLPLLPQSLLPLLPLLLSPVNSRPVSCQWGGHNSASQAHPGVAYQLAQQRENKVLVSFHACWSFIPQPVSPSFHVGSALQMQMKLNYQIGWLQMPTCGMVVHANISFQPTPTSCGTCQTCQQTQMNRQTCT